MVNLVNSLYFFIKEKNYIRLPLQIFLYLFVLYDFYFVNIFYFVLLYLNLVTIPSGGIAASIVFDVATLFWLLILVYLYTVQIIQIFLLKTYIHCKRFKIFGRFNQKQLIICTLLVSSSSWFFIDYYFETNVNRNYR